MHRLVIPSLAMSLDDSLPTDLASAHALIIAQRQALSAAETARHGGGERGAIPRAVDREAQVHDQEAAARSVRPILGAWRAARSARASTRRFGGGCGASGYGGPNSSRGGEREDDGAVVRTAPAGSPSAARASAARTDRLSGALSLPVLRRYDIAQDRRGRDRDAGAHSAPVEGDPACAREVLLPSLRSDQPAAGAVAPDRPWARRAEATRPYPVLQVRPASAAQPSKRRLCAGRR